MQNEFLPVTSQEAPPSNRPLELEKLPWREILKTVQRLDGAAGRMQRLAAFGHTGGRAFHDACIAHSELKALVAPYREAPQGYLYSGDGDLPEAWLDVCRVSVGTALSSSDAPWPVCIRLTLGFIIQTIHAAGIWGGPEIVIPIPATAPKGNDEFAAGDGTAAAEQLANGGPVPPDTFILGGKPVEIKGLGFRLIEYLWKHDRHLATARNLCLHIWDNEEAESTRLRPLIKRVNDRFVAAEIAATISVKRGYVQLTIG